MNKLLIILLSFMGISVNIVVQGQSCDAGGCPGLIKNYPTGTFSATSNWASVDPFMSAGNWTLFNVVSGNTYEWTYCSAVTPLAYQNFDAQLTLYNNSTGQILCTQNNSGLSGCINAPYLRYTATFTGVVKLLTSLNNGSGCQNSSGSITSALAWRRSGCTLPSPPSGVTATPNSSSQITISWQPVAGATKYEVGYAQGNCPWSGGGMSLQTQSTSRAITNLNPGTTYRFIVLTETACGWSSTFSSCITGTTSGNQVQQYAITLSSNPSNGGTTSGGGTFNSGAPTTLRASANSGWSFVNWTEGGNFVSSNSSYPITVNSSRNLVANFTQSSSQQFTITATSSPSGGGTISGAGTFNPGTPITLNAIANSGWNFVNWTEGGNSVSSNASYQFTVNSNRTLVANFTQSSSQQFTITATSSPSGGGSISGAGTFNPGTPITLNATANAGWNFVNWTEGGNSVSYNASYQFTVNSNRTLVANFTQSSSQQFTITATSSPSGGGSISGAGIFNPGTPITLNAIANSGWNFVNWTEGGNSVSSNATYQFTVNSNRTLVANFTQSSSQQFTITATSSPSGGGSISGAGTFNPGTPITLNAIANSGWNFVNWTEGGNSVSSNATYQFTVNSNRTLAANFTQQITPPPSPKYLDIADLRIYADNIPASGNPRTISGNIYIVPQAGGCKNNFYRVEGSMSVNTETFVIIGNGSMYCTNVSSLGRVNIYTGPYVLQAFDDYFVGVNFAVVNIALKLAGLDLEIKKIQFLCGGIRIEGILPMPPVLTKIASTSASIDASIHSLYLTTSEYNLAGGIKISNARISKKVMVENLALDYDPYPGIFKGSVRLLLSPFFNLDGEMHIKNRKLDKVSIGVAAASIHKVIPLGTSGLGIDSVGGGLENISNPSLLNLYIGARIVPQVPIKSMAHCVIKASYDVGGKEFSANGNFNLFGRDVGSVGFKVKPDLFSLTGHLNLYNFLVGYGSFSISKPSSTPQIRGNFNASLQVPKFNQWYLSWINDIAPAGSALASTSNYVTNEFLAGMATIHTPFISKKIYYYLSYGSKWDFDFGRNKSFMPLYVQNQLPFGRTFRVTSPLIYSFNLDTKAEDIIISAKGDLNLPNLTVYLGNGDSLTTKNYKKHKNVEYFSNPAGFVSTFVITNPPQGIYYVWSPNADTIQVLRTNRSPAITLDNVINNTAQKTLQVFYNAYDPDDNALISFGLDNDKNNANGILLADSLSENNNAGSAVLSYSAIKPGSYYVYAAITDGAGQTQYVYFDKAVAILPSSILNAPDGLVVIKTDTSLIFSFNRNNTGPLNYLIHYSNLPNTINMNSPALSIGDENVLEVTNFSPGKYYEFAVTAIDTTGDESNLSNIATLTWVSGVLNNYPVFKAANIVTKVKVNSPYSLNIPATDPDNDPLVYSITSGPTDAQINNSGVLTWIPQTNNLGYKQFKINVRDGKGGFDSITFQILVYDSTISRPFVSLNNSNFDNYTEKGIIKLTDPVYTAEDTAKLFVQVTSTSDPKGITINASKAGDVPDFLSQLNFSNTPGSTNSIFVKRSDTIWLRYTSPITGLTATNYSLFNFLKTDFVFKDSSCVSDSVTFYNASKGNDLQFKWDFGDGTSSNQISPTHVYPTKMGSGSKKFLVNLKITSANGTVDTLSKSVTIFNIPDGKISIQGTPKLCFGDTVVLTSSGAERYKWSTGETTSSIKVIVPGNHNLMTSNGNRCFSYDTIKINANPLPVFNIDSTKKVCFGSSIIIGANGTPRDIYKWTPATNLSNDAIPNPVANPIVTRSYLVKVTNSYGCEITKPVRVIVNPLPKANAGKDITIAQGMSIQIGGSPTAAGNGPFSYRWLPTAGLNSISISNPTATPSSRSNYKVEVKDVNGCADTASINVHVLPGNKEIYVYPNPATSMFNIIVPHLENGEYDLILRNGLGMIIKKQGVTIINSSLITSLSVDHVAPGYYFLSIENNKERIVYKIEIIK